MICTCKPKEYECAYCTTICTPGPIVITMYGQAKTYTCKDHGTYYVMQSPMVTRGYQIGPVG